MVHDDTKIIDEDRHADSSCFSFVHFSRLLRTGVKPASALLGFLSKASSHGFC